MSGHSKWSKIKRQKGAADAKRSALFTKLGNAISLAAREMGGDLETNFKLRLAVDKARSANMPRENIDRAIKRGAGELAGDQIEEIIYEGYGPLGVAFVIEALTDNKNRTVGSVRHILAKHDGNLGGSTLWLFDRKGVIRIDPANLKMDKDEFLLKAIDLGTEDVQEDEDSLIIYTDPGDLQKVKELLEKEGLEIEYAELEYVAKDQIKVVDETLKNSLQKIYVELDEDPDVSNYYTNTDY
ncbi:MAG TPA: YebC/PmpR family DNA-binding transcriptional regulator [Patescibacteria group bacterium]